MIDYLPDPKELRRRSFAAIRAECDLTRLPAGLAPVAVRLVHACGMPDIIDDLASSPEAAAAGRNALQAGAVVVCDSAMVAQGIQRRLLPRNNQVVCTLDDSATAGRAATERTTRAAAAVAAWAPHLADAVVAIGNAPTAFFRPLEELDMEAPRPAVIP